MLEECLIDVGSFIIDECLKKDIRYTQSWATRDTWILSAAITGELLFNSFLTETITSLTLYFRQILYSEI